MRLTTTAGTVDARTKPGPLVAMATCWIAGAVMSRAALTVDIWLGATGVAAATMLVMACWHRRRGVRIWAYLSLVLVAATWTSLDHRYIRHDDVRGFITNEPQLVQVEGTIEDEPWLRPAQAGMFAEFSYQPPVTSFLLRTRSILVDGQWRDAQGMLLVKIFQADPWVREGLSIRATGWLQSFNGPYNPGEFDYRSFMTRRGIAGRLALELHGNWQCLDGGGPSRIGQWRRSIRQAAASSLRLGMVDHAKRTAFLDLILLGQRSREANDLHVSFRRVGLAHLLSISGAHLGILLGLTWLVVKLVVSHPPRASLIVLVVLGMYLALVPLRVPIVRAAIMAGLFLIGHATRKRIVGLDLLALAALVVLIWKPGDLFTSGFQLSFGVVAALLTFSRHVSEWLWTKPRAMASADRIWTTMGRWLADYVAVNIVAFLTAMPLLAYHFALFSPLTVLLSLIALPAVTATLGLGYLKVLCGLVLPSVGLLLAGPTQWVADIMMGMVDHASRWPGAAVVLRESPSISWTLATLGLMVALLAGKFARRGKTFAISAVLCLLWLIAHDRWPSTDFASLPSDRPALQLYMLAVGDGSCYLLRTNQHTIMFDCGSQGFLDIGTKTVVPALRQLGIRRIDTLMLSHADLDHFCGSLDLADAVPTGRVLAPPQLLRGAQQDDTSAAAFLVRGLEQRGLAITAVARGWSEDWGDASAQLLWPPENLRDMADNDTSLVLSVRAAGKRILLNGDIQQDAITVLLNEDTGALRSEVSDLPHHGSFIEASPRWLEAVRPTIVLQSCGRRRLLRDKWEPFLQRIGTKRLVSEQLGMVELAFARDRPIQQRSFK